MARDIEYDDRRLRQLFAELNSKRQKQVFRQAFRRGANTLRREAVKNLRGSIRSDRDIEKGIRSIVFKQTVGFRVTVGTGRGNVGFHKTRRGVLKPVLMWAEDGTEYRRTRGSAKRPSRVTGKMKRYGFLERAKNQTVGRITNDIRESVANGIIKTSQKYGCQ